MGQILDGSATPTTAIRHSREDLAFGVKSGFAGRIEVGASISRATLARRRVSVRMAEERGR